MQNSKVIEVELWMHLFTPCIEQVNWLLLFLLTEAGLVGTLRIANILLSDVESLCSFELVVPRVLQ